MGAELEAAGAADVARRVSSGEMDRGILICGTGIGMCIAANKFPGVRAAPCHDDLTAEFTGIEHRKNLLADALRMGIANLTHVAERDRFDD